MHPAKSVIFFTTASGAGYGLVIWLGVMALLGLAPADRMFGVVAFGLAISLITGGLMSSTFHLGHPERAWRALSQWRSSWLSREGVAAIVAFAPIGFFALLWVFKEQNTGVASLVGLTAAIASFITVYCTAMIYASLKSIPAWKNTLTPVNYLLLSLMTGAVIAAFLSAAWGFASITFISIAALVFVSLALGGKLAYWSSVKRAAPVSTSGSATGLNKFGDVTLIDAPHTESNYLLEEMGFKIARKHAEKLRRIAIWFGFVAPLLLILLSLALSSPVASLLVLGLAVVATGVGIVVERWLFFAEAKHVVTLYYGEQQI